MIRSHPNPRVKFDIGIASYAFREKPLSEVLEVTNMLDIRKLAVKSMHMPLDASSREIANIIDKAREKDVDIYAGG